MLAWHPGTYSSSEVASKLLINFAAPPKHRASYSPHPPAMSSPTASLKSILSELNSQPLPAPSKITSLLTSAKRHLLTLDALLPTPTSPLEHLRLARSVLETGALLSIRLHEPDAFTRYFQQLQPFYELRTGTDDDGSSSSSPGQRSKITGLYLLLLLTKGDYAGFHTVLEGLEVEGTANNEESIGMRIEGEEETTGDKYIQYPIKLERWLMEGSYDRVWGATKREGVPSEEFGEFSEVNFRLPLPFPFRMKVPKRSMSLLFKISLDYKKKKKFQIYLHS